MTDIPLSPRSRRKENEHEDYCYAADSFPELQKEFQGAVWLVQPATLYPVCPAIRWLLKEEEERQSAIAAQSIDNIKKGCADWASICRILSVLDSLRVGSKPSWATADRYMHTENLLEKRMGLIRNDLLRLPPRLEKTHPETSRKCRELILRFVREIAAIVNGNRISAFLVPDRLQEANHKWTWTKFSTWRRDQIECTRPEYQNTMVALTRYYPMEAIRAMLPLYNALCPIFGILSEHMEVGKMIEEHSAEIAETEPANVVKADIEEQPKEQKDESLVRIEAAIGDLRISHSSVKQAAKNKDIYSERKGTKKNSPYLVYKSEVKEKFGPHGEK